MSRRGLVTGAAGAIIASGSSALRLVLAATITFALLALFERDSRAGFVALVLWLPLLALTRRMLIGPVGWTTNDPLLLVAPTVVVLLAIKLFVLEHRRLAAELLSYLVLGLLALIVIGSFNPRNGSVAVGLGGLLFMGMPVLWYLVARELHERQTTRAILTIVVAMAVAIAAYGFFQSLVALPAWDRAWVEIAGYGSLFLERDVPNTFGTFASTAEYTLFMGVATAICVGFALHGRWMLLPALTIVLPALFLSSNRSGFVFAIAAVVVMLVLRFTRPRFVPAALAAIVVVLAFSAPAITAALQAAAQSTDNPRVEYQLSGLGDPLNREQSTLTLHAQLFYDGVRSGIADPVGRGTGVTNNAIRRFGPGGEEAAQYSNTEVDVSNAFVSLGLVGGLVFLTLFATALAYAIRSYLGRRGAIELAIVGLLVATLGHWLSGGHYAVTPLVWITLGWTAAGRRAMPPTPEGDRSAEAAGLDSSPLHGRT